MSTSLAILGTTPRGWRSTARFARFTDVQRQLGELIDHDPAHHPLAHAACHGLMNGLDRVVLHGLEEPVSVASLVEGLGFLHTLGPCHAVVLPGCVDGVAINALLEAWRRVRASTSAWHQATLWLDPPSPGTLDATLRHAEAYASLADGVRVIGPWVTTTSPGHRRAALLPPTCLVAPLFLGATSALCGVHDLENYPCTPQQLASLEAAGGGWLMAQGVRRQVTLACPSPQPPRSRRAVARTTSPLEETLEEACEAVLMRGQPQGPALWAVLRRTCTSVLQGFVQRGVITGFQVRCDAETNEGSAAPVIQIWVKEPRRVEQVILRLHRW